MGSSSSSAFTGAFEDLNGSMAWNFNAHKCVVASCCYYDYNAETVILRLLSGACTQWAGSVFLIKFSRFCAYRYDFGCSKVYDKLP